MADTPSLSSPHPSDIKFEIGDYVWAKVRGYGYWPAQVSDGENIKRSKALKNPYCVYFFGTHDNAWVNDDSIKPYLEFKNKYWTSNKSKSFKTGLSEIEASMSGTKLSQPSTPVAASPAVVSTPKANQTPKSEPQIFKPKKVNLSTPSTPSVQRDYSRTPFKKEKRNYESPSDSVNESLKRPSESKASADASEKKRVKVTPQPPRKSSSSKPVAQPQFGGDDDLEEAPAVLEKMEEVSPRKRNSAAKPSSLKFGFIGLGKLGQPVLRHLLDTGHEITMWNRTISKCKEFEKLGAHVVKTPGDVVRESDITFSCLSNAEAASKIFFGNCGVEQEINATKGYVELTPMDPNTSINIESSIKAHGGRYLEAPFHCSIPKQIEEAKVVATIAGNRSLFDDCASCFQSICAHAYFLSESAGIAAKMNIVLSTLYGNIIGSLVESLTLVDRLGLIQKDFVEIISHSPFSSQLIENKAQSMLDSTFIREIPIDNIRRDLSYALQLSNQNNYSTPITATTNEVFKQKKHHYF